MDKHVFLCETESEYESLVYEAPHVALTEDDGEVHYDETVESREYKFLDILWNDGKVTTDLREDDTEHDPDLAPIAICVIPTDYLGEGEKARFMSLLLVDKTGKGSDSAPIMNWGPNSSSPDLLEDMYMELLCKNPNNGDDVKGKVELAWGSNHKVPNLTYNEEGTAWQNAQQYLTDPEKKYILADIDGLGNTKKICEALDFASNTDYVFVNINNFNPNPHPKYNIKLDWYLPAAGELANLMYNTGYEKGRREPEGSLNEKMYEMYKKRLKWSSSSVSCVYFHWSSTPVSATNTFYFGLYEDHGLTGDNGERISYPAHAVAFLQL